MEQEAQLRAALLAFAPLALVSLAVFGRWLWLLRQRGGRLPVAHFGVPDLILTVALVFFLGASGIAAFAATAQQAQVLDLRTLGLVAITELVALAAVISFVVFRRVSLSEIIGLRRLPLLRVLGYALLFLAVAAPVVVLLSVLAHTLLPGEEEQAIVSFVREEARSGHQRATVLVFLSAAVLAPLVEEFFFRGYFYGSLKRFCGPIAAALVTAALFALLHTNAAALAPLFFLALAFTIAYEWTGSLLVPFTMHLLFNSTNLLLMLWQVKHQVS